MVKTKKQDKKSKKKHKERDERNRVSKKSKKSKKSHKKHKDKKDKIRDVQEQQPQPTEVHNEEGEFAIPLELMNSKSHAPETPEEYQKRQSQIRREVDPITGRTRLIKGDSEILEEIVTKTQHAEINRMATRGDGSYYQEQSLRKAAKRN